ncbi:DUF4913 domain-containing protein [Glutamicibacter ardleyensis]|uniref:DUF4913 domain-containing protein n=1 Tax=Glutamicibacter ardleyensis TaxID=225894 RepID=A0ABQ2DUR3_9MICC|nr:DUF4913 domain-containing protein [Glutamicibacter ardleyensis]GGJ73134.1 hypothetical protein GCM10007173_35160 [Glutamicibacter ardleyensis]
MSEQSNRDELIELLVPIVEPLVERQGKVEQGLQEQEAVLVELAGQLETLLKKSKEPEPSPWNLYQGKPEENAGLLEEINAWLPWFNTTYGAGQSTNMIPPCWFRHPNVVAHLMGFYLSWKAANYGTASPNSDLVYWNLRYLPDVLDIVNAPVDKGGMAGCRREHRAPDRVDPVPESLNEQFTQWLDGTYLTTQNNDPNSLIPQSTARQ